jgi:hypothetical protein
VESKIYLGNEGVQDLSWQWSPRFILAVESKIYLGNEGVQDLSWQWSPRFILATKESKLSTWIRYNKGLDREVF